tara:strand:+ start:72706 stop:72858 length:153 start_codon:yes stop_codon:yes gene_type:complete
VAAPNVFLSQKKLVGDKWLIRTLRFPLSLTQNVGTAEAAAQNPPYHMQNR